MENKKEIILVIRRNKEYWLKNEYKTFFHPYIVDVINVWDSIFKINFIDFRNRIRDIASSTYMKNKFDRIFLYSHQDPRFIMKNVSEEEKNVFMDSIIVPIDEDDWISPDLAEILRGVETDKKIFVWSWYTSYSDIKKTPYQYEKDKNRGMTETCSWAIKGYSSFLGRRNNLKIKSKEEFSDIFFIEEALSVKISHIAQINFLKKVANLSVGNKDKIISILFKQLEREMGLKVNLPHVFQKQLSDYSNLLKELFLSASNISCT